MSDLTDRLETIEGESPREIRSHAVEALYDEIDADFGLFFKCVEIDGHWRYTAPVYVGDPEISENFRPHVGGPVFPSPWTKEYVDGGQIESFVRMHAHFPEEYLYEFPVQVELMRPLGMTDELRAVFFDGRKFYGWLGLMRRDNDDRFCDADEKRANASIEGFKKALRAAENLERDIFRPGSLFVVCSPDGRIERASWEAEQWLTKQRIEMIGRVVRRNDSGHARSYDAAELHVARLDGESGVRYVVDIERAALAEYDPLVQLTERQREVAEFAAVGATNAEIAEALDVSPSTVKYHLRRIYVRLDLDQRVDLAELA